MTTSRAVRNVQARRLWTLLAAAAVLSGLRTGAAVMPTPGVTLAPPTPRACQNCHRSWRGARRTRRTATARRACARSRPQGRSRRRCRHHPQPRQADRRSGHRQQPVSFRDPITGEITGFDVDIAGEIARDIFGTPSQVEYRILSSADRIAALQNNQVDVVVKTMTITCERKKQVGFSTVYLNANQRILALAGLVDLAAVRPVWQAGVRREGHHVARSDSADQPAADHRRVVTWADCLVALQQRQVDAVSTDDSDPGRPGVTGSVPCTSSDPASVTEPYGIGVQPSEHRARAVRQRHAGADPPRWHLVRVVPQVVNGARPGSGAPGREVLRTDGRG